LFSSDASPQTTASLSGDSASDAVITFGSGVGVPGAFRGHAYPVFQIAGGQLEFDPSGSYATGSTAYTESETIVGSGTSFAGTLMLSHSTPIGGMTLVCTYTSPTRFTFAPRKLPLKIVVSFKAS
jgi:hypothetical protein